MPKIPIEDEYAWYILKYHEEFNGRLSNADCMRKIGNETGRFNMKEYVLRKKELTKMSAEEISILKKILEKDGLYVDF